MTTTTTNLRCAGTGLMVGYAHDDVNRVICSCCGQPQGVILDGNIRRVTEHDPR